MNLAHKRLLIVSHLWPRQDFSHLGIFVADQIAELAKRYDVKVAVPVDLMIRREELGIGQLVRGFSIFQGRTNPQLLELANLKPQIIPYRANFFRQAQAPTTAQRLAAACSHLSVRDYDLIHAHTVFPDGLACALWLKSATIPLVVTAHGSDVHSMSPGVRRSLQPLLRRVDCLLPVSRSLAQQLIELGADEKKIQVLPNGFDDALFQIANPPVRQSKKIAFLGRLGKVKRVDLLIRALRHCPPDVTLEIAGDGPEWGRLQELTRTLQLQHRIKFLGVLSRRQVPDFLSSAALMVLVSEKEGWPTVIFEALACGTPVLATAVGGIPEALADPAIGRILPPDLSAETLAQAISQGLATPWDRSAIRQHAKQFSWASLTEKLSGIYQDLFQQPRLRRIEKASL